MLVRVFNHFEGVKFLTPMYPEAMEKDTQKLFPTIPYFDCDFSELPKRRNTITGECQRCHWKADMVNKKVVVEKTKPCIHDELKRLDAILISETSTIQEQLQVMLDLEKIKRRK